MNIPQPYPAIPINASAWALCLSFCMVSASPSFAEAIEFTPLGQLVKKNAPDQVAQRVTSRQGIGRAGEVERYIVERTQIARGHHIPARLFYELISAESNWNPSAVSSKGAIGLAQLMPATAREFGVNPHDPIQNMEGGARYLAAQYRHFGSWRLALAAYNAGPQRVVHYGGVPPFRETQAYVARILSRSGMDGDSDTASTSIASSAVFDDGPLARWSLPLIAPSDQNPHTLSPTVSEQ